ncbi:MAG: hypothetical protein ACXVYS_04140 [Oryzihumus sp.]
MGWYQQFFVETGRAAAAWALLGFVVTFAVTRLVTRRIRAAALARAAEPSAQHAPEGAGDRGGSRGGLGDVYIGGVHVHHQVWGILLVLLTALLEFRYAPQSPWAEVLAALFGTGAALTLDEFALWFHLDDVYWGQEGRKSIDAILLGGALGVVLMLQASPIGATTRRAEVAQWLYVTEVGIHLATAGICFVKGKIATGMIGVVVPIVATVGAIRLAKPDSVWARRRYGPAKRVKTQSRFGEAYRRRHDRIRDLLGGALPTPEHEEGARRD